MNVRHSCPLCQEPFDDRTDLQVHLEVNHRKSEVVSALIDVHDREPAADDDRPTVDGPAAPSV